MPSISQADFMEENCEGSDSDTNSNDEVPPEYYQPISAVDEDDQNDEAGEDDLDPQDPYLSNGHCTHHETESKISSIQLNDDADRKSCSDEDEQATTEAVTMEEDESQRNAPLTAETTARVIEAMRAVSFPGVAPAWADQFPEDRLIEQIRSMSRSSGGSTATTNQNWSNFSS